MKKSYSTLVIILIFLMVFNIVYFVKPLSNFLPTFAVQISRIPQPKIHFSGSSQAFLIKAKSKSYYAKDNNGALIPEKRNGKRYFRVSEDQYTLQRTFINHKTALIIMDPWKDSGSEFLNSYYEPIIRQKLIPLVLKAIQLNLPIIILTNDPLKNNADYGSNVFPEFQRLADEGKLYILYHQDFDNRTFSEYLKSMSIDTLIYSGFASNMCVIGRDLGMIPMRLNGFKLFFIPEASAAAEFKESWKTGEVHKATTALISQAFAELIELNEFLQLSPPQSRPAYKKE